jgi:hypothetical protein
LLITSYFQELQTLIDSFPPVVAKKVTYHQITSYIGYIRGELFFTDGSFLHIREYLNFLKDPFKISYSYHYQKEAKLIFRYDNAPHYSQLPDFPHHRHGQDELSPDSSEMPELKKILEEIAKHLVRK